MKRALVTVLLMSTPFVAQAQMGGRGVFKVLNSPMSSRVASLGGMLVSIYDNDPTLVYQNPAVLNAGMHGKISGTYLSNVSAMNYGSLTYSSRLRQNNEVTDSGKKWMPAMAQFGIQYYNYGSFTRADEAGNVLGQFGAAEYALYAAASKQLNRWSVGATVKFVYSQLESYTATGAAIDAGVCYRDTAHGLTIGAGIRNAGTQLTTYAGRREQLPFEAQAGISLKPKHAPARLTLTFHDLQYPDYTYINSNKPRQTDLSTGLPIEEKIPFSEKIARHVSFGTELLISKGFQIRVGYNHQQRKEMALPNARGLVGYSMGVGIKVGKFNVSYARAGLSAAGATNTFTLVADINQYLKK